MMKRFSFVQLPSRYVFLLTACGILLSAACCETTENASPPADNVPTTDPPAESVDEAENSATAELPREMWDVSYMQGSKVGHFHTTFTPLEEEGRQLVKIEQDGTLTLVRFGQEISQKMGFKSIETPQGELVRFESSMNLGPVPATTVGEVNDRSLEATVSTLNQRQTRTLAWNPDWGGFFAAEQSLRRKPMTPGEKRSFKALMPMATDVAIADVTLEAQDYEMTELLEGQAKLLRVAVTMEMGAPDDMEFVVWVDEQGDTVKQYLPGMDMETYRVSREVALREDGGGGFDLGRFTTVKIRDRLPDAHRTKRVVYRVRVNGSDAAEMFPTSGSQSVKPAGDGAAEITVIAVRPDTPAEPATKPDPPTDDDLSPNSLIQSDDRRVVEMAAAVAPDEQDIWQLVKALEGNVHTQMTSKNFSQAFATAAEVARSREGDCTEHAVLLAAMCRARNIPARVAIGLVYYPPLEGFAYHMWNEVWIDGRWVPMDATLGLGGIGGGHLKLADSNLKGASGYSTFLPVTKVMGQLAIDVVEVE